VLNGLVGVENLELEDRYNIPQKDNGKFIREWIEEGEVYDPLRKRYPIHNCPTWEKKSVRDDWKNQKNCPVREHSFFDENKEKKK